MVIIHPIKSDGEMVYRNINSGKGLTKISAACRCIPLKNEFYYENVRGQTGMPLFRGKSLIITAKYR